MFKFPFCDYVFVFFDSLFCCKLWNNQTNTSLVDRDIFDSVKVGKYGCSLTRSFIWGDLLGI